MEKDESSCKMDNSLSPSVVIKEQRVQRSSKYIISQVKTLESVTKINNQLNKGKKFVCDQVQHTDTSLMLNDAQ